MKRNILAVVIPALLVAGAANAAEIYNKDGNKLDLYGKVDARHQFSDNAGQDGDESYVRFGFKGETQITDQLTGYGQWEYNVQANHAESQGDKGNKTRLGFAGLKFAEFGSFDYGRNYGVIYDVNAWTDMLPVFGGDSISNSDNYMTGRSTGLATYRNTNFFGLVDGLNFALQYQGKNEDGRNGTTTDAAGVVTSYDNLKDQNGDGFGISSTYDIGYGVNFGAGFSSSNRTDQQKRFSTAEGDKAQAWNVGAKYDANNVYLAVMYAETQNMTPYGDANDTIANKTRDIEITAQYQFDFGLRPSLGYVQSKGKDLNANGDNQDLLKYVSVGSYYYFNKNMSTYVDYKINLLDENDFTRANGLNTDDVVGVGLVYQF
ncbi:porin OmpF [Yersinia enterocolitica]|uniref:Outer membrane protein F n=1 Tax=Yersinia enterocolitica TaxID=630 RepID=E2FH82_YEREN|nr:porin OmpF [Yersinia enterocolitica]ADK27732.1 outer membrane protein F [Yersinia enterocolitica]ADK27733.1 outer membrane protein F [Yersinia enterocolitica]ADK27734.1 outer membrane protein F [Yersinia enterocolitica]ADK27735.1 outer membrane protein F [Yersinia enterocolitica]ADK27736.1 outer membrane protein F [Yersinia enterocolitica]